MKITHSNPDSSLHLLIKQGRKAMSGISSEFLQEKLQKEFNPIHLVGEVYILYSFCTKYAHNSGFLRCQCMWHVYMLSSIFIVLHIKWFVSLRWLPTVLTVSTPEKGLRTKNEVFVSTLGLSSWHSQWRLGTHLGFHFRSYEYIADCCHGNKQSQR